MICLLLIMTMFFVNGIEHSEQKVKHSGTVLREEEINAKTKAWLLMVESGKVDEEELRRITPKSIFIAPLLTNSAGTCPEGYRHDHLGKCVKVIKIDPKVQLELLLKRLNMLYGGKKEEEEDEEQKEPVQVSSGPLHFSIPISNANETNKTEEVKTEIRSSTTTPETPSFPELIPIPLPMVLLNQTNQTKEFESSGMEPLNDTDSFVTTQFEGSGFASGDSPSELETTPYASLLSEDTDYLEVTETETTTEIQSTTEAITDITTTATTPVEDTNSTESYQSITDLPSVNDSDVEITKENVQSLKALNSSNTDIIRFPSDDEVRLPLHPPSPPVSGDYIRFPDDTPSVQPSFSYHQPSSLPNLNNQYQIHPSAISRQQFWWLPENWKVEESQPKSRLVKFWSRLPLIHDVSYSEGSRENYRKSYVPNEHQPQVVNSFQRSHDFPSGYNPSPPVQRRGKPFRSNRFQEIVVTPGQNFRVQR